MHQDSPFGTDRWGNQGTPELKQKKHIQVTQHSLFKIVEEEFRQGRGTQQNT